MVGISWWVDSAVAAYLLMQQWYEVIAWFMLTYLDESNPACTTKQDIEQFHAVRTHLWIDAFEIFDFRKEYCETVLSYLYDGYLAGITPNPDILCNTIIKFWLFLHEWLWYADMIATWHYAKIINWCLYQAHDVHKDQTYFLSWLEQSQLDHVIFPLADITKTHVRQIAHDIWLPNATRKDSQWLCFVWNIPMKKFLVDKIWTQPWNILYKWNIVWKHDGAYLFTPWQRRWLWLPFQAYVSHIDIASNIVTVDTSPISTQTISLSHRRWRWEPIIDWYYDVKIRHGQSPISAYLVFWDIVTITYDQPITWISQWQIWVAYHNHRVIWSWIII